MKTILNMWRNRVKEILHKKREAKLNRKYSHVAYLKGYLKALEECRIEVRRYVS